MDTTADTPCRAYPPDTRLHARRPGWGWCAIRPADQPAAAPIVGRLVDISEGGVGLWADRAIHVGQRVVLELQPLAGPPLTAEAVVYWFTDDAQAGTRVGCAWARPLTAAEVETFCVRPPPAGGP